MVEAGEPVWRGKQLAEAMYRQRITELSEITTLPKPLRQRLAAEGWVVGQPKIVQVFQSADGQNAIWSRAGAGMAMPGRRNRGPRRQVIVAGVAETVETVWMPEGDDGESGDGSDADNTQILVPHPFRVL